MKLAASRKVDSELHFLPPAASCQRRTCHHSVSESGEARSPRRSSVELQCWLRSICFTSASPSNPYKPRAQTPRGNVTWQWRKVELFNCTVDIIASDKVTPSKNKQCTTYDMFTMQESWLDNSHRHRQSTIYSLLITVRRQHTRYCWSAVSPCSRWMNRPIKPCSSRKSSWSMSSTWSLWSCTSGDTMANKASTWHQHRHTQLHLQNLKHQHNSKLRVSTMLIIHSQKNHMQPCVKSWIFNPSLTCPWLWSTMMHQYIHIVMYRVQQLKRFYNKICICSDLWLNTLWRNFSIICNECQHYSYNICEIPCNTDVSNFQ